MELRLDDIESIEYIDAPTVYDLSIEDNHNYFLDVGYPVLVHNSGKTVNILIWLLYELDRQRNKTLTICRKSLPSLKGSVLRDFIWILEELNLFEDSAFHKTDLIYHFRGNTIEFISLDQPTKIRGRKRDYLFLNESNEIDYESFIQLSLRTTKKIIIDYNPSMEFHWIYDQVIPREDSDFLQSTFKDNPFLDQSIKDEIYRLKDVDPELWKIYGLGEKGQVQGLIFPNFLTAKTIPEFARKVGYGLDFGYSNDPSCLVALYVKGKDIYFDELFYQTGLNNNDIASLLEQYGVRKNFDMIYADSAEPKSIAEIRMYGFNIKPVKKGADSVKKGIDTMKQFNIHVTESSINGLKEFRNYKWLTDKDGKPLQKPVKFWDHFIDASRYITTMKLGKLDFSNVYLT